MNVGFIGLGTMGRHMASNLIKGGHKLVVYDVRREAAARLERARRERPVLLEIDEREVGAPARADLALARPDAETLRRLPAP